jgi:hypothetical protein
MVGWYCEPCHTDKRVCDMRKREEVYALIHPITGRCDLCWRQADIIQCTKVD